MKYLLRIAIAIILTSSVLTCSKDSKKIIKADIPPVKFGSITFPAPTFDTAIAKIANDYKEKYKAKTVMISRPVWYSSDTENKYWLKVEFVNPELNEKKFKDFGREVAKDLIGHLTNDKEFDKIEVSKVQKTGFIITFTTTTNAFYYRDSLR